MKSLVITLFLLSVLVSTSQSEQLRLDTFSHKFQTHYNDSNDEAFHEMLDPVMKNLLPEYKLSNLLNDVKTNFGLILSMEYSGKHNSAYVFKTTFENITTDLFIALNENDEISAMFIPGNSFENSSVLIRNSTKMVFPFNQEAFVYWGGDTLDLNYHMGDINQQYAYDILMVANGAPYKGDSALNESYFVFGKDIIAPCDAKVIKLIDGVTDNTPGEVNKNKPLGNYIIIATERKEYLLLGHLKLNSIVVKEGELIKQGQVIAQCGNSGNTTQPHLHLQLQNTKFLYNTLGAKLYFDEVFVNGELRRDYMPKKEDFVKNPIGKKR